MLYICIPFSGVSRPVLHVIHMHTFFSRTATCITRHAYAYLFQPYTDLFYTSYICIPFSTIHRPVLHVIHMHTFFNHTLTYSTRHTHAYLFQPPAEVKEGVAGVCERCVRCSYPQVFTVQQHVQMSVCVHLHPDTTARSDII